MKLKKNPINVLGLTIFLIVMVCIPPVLAAEWDNIKTYNPEDRSITVSNSFLQVIGLDKIAKITPTTPHVNYVIRGEDRLVAEFTIESYLDYTEKAWDGMSFYNLIGGREINREYKIRYKELEPYDYYTYDQTCEQDIEINKTTGKPDLICRSNPVLNHGSREVWKDLDLNADLPKGTLKIGIFTDVLPGDQIEFIPKWFNLELSEYSTWVDSFNVGLNIYYDFNSSSNILDAGNYNMTSNEGTPIYNETNCLIGLCGQTWLGNNFRIQANNVTNWQGDFTMNLWVRGIDNEGGNPFFLGYNDDVISPSVGWNTPTKIYFSDAWNGATTQTAYNIGAGVWFMITITRDNDTSGGNVSMYVNGTILGSGVKSKVNNTLNDVLLGNHPNNAFDWHGQLDEFSYWNRTLSQTEITNLFNEGVGLTYVATEPESVLVGLEKPDDDSNFNNVLQYYNSSATFSGGNFTNATLHLWNGATELTNLTIISGMPNATFINSSYKLYPGTWKWNYEYCGIEESSGNTICKYATANRSVSFNSTISFDYNFTRSVYSTTNQLFGYNFSFDSSSYTLASVQLTYNNTNYSMSSLDTTGDTRNYTVKIDTAPVDIQTNVPLAFVVGLTNSSGTNYYTTKTLNQTVTPIHIYYCNATYNYSYINISFKDEETTTSINATVNPLTVQYYLGNGATYKTFTYTNLSEEPSLPLCFYPMNQSMKNNGFNIRYSNSNYETRNVFFSASPLTNTTLNKTLYLLKSTTGIYVTFQLINSALQPISGVFMNATNTFGVVGSGYTDSSGGITFFLNPSISHDFVANKSGYSLYTTTITPTQSSYTITLSSSTSSSSSLIDADRGLSFTFTPLSEYLLNKTLYIFNLSLVSNYWDLTSWGFNITDNNSQLVSAVSSALTTGGSINSTITTGNNKTFKVTIYWEHSGNRTQVFKYYTIWDDVDVGWSLLNFINDFKTYLGTDDGIFGLEKGFGLNIVIFMIIFFITGIMSWKFGLYSPVAVSFMVFVLTALFDFGLGLISNYNDITGLATTLTGFVLVGIYLKEASGY